MEDPQWERALDAIAEQIRGALDQETDARGFAVAPPCVRTVGTWVGALMGLLDERQRARDPEGASEVVDVLAMLLQASADGHWRRRWGDTSVEDGLYATQRLETIVEALTAAISSDADAQDTLCDAISILASLLMNATHETEINSVLQALLRFHIHASPLETAILGTDPLQPDACPDSTMWAACLLRFALMFTNAPPSRKEDANKLLTLRLLTGADDAIDTWVDTAWETTWHLHRSARVRDLLFGSAKDCVTSVRRVFHGFSVAQEDDMSSSSSPTEAAFVLALRDGDKLLGLVHGVDVTFIKNGRVHPHWKETRRQVRLTDVDDALREGYSVGVRGMQARSLRVFTLCNKLQTELGQHVNANLYWTPPGQQGFDLHIDDHCVFAIQLKGRKRWVLHELQDELPRLYDDTSSQLATNPPQVHSEIILEEGDVLYVPRGVAHYADTKGIDEESIHLTIGVEIEAKYTNARILEELKRTQITTIEDWTWSARVKSKGLMAWHLQSKDALCRHVGSIVGVPMYDEMHSSFAGIQVALFDERALFLRQRSLRARAMATLHEAARGGQQTHTDANAPTRPSKKQRL